MTYQLFFKDSFIATVTQTDDDFPNLIGTYQLNYFDKIEGEEDLMISFISFSTELSKHIEDEEKYGKMIEDEAWKYQILYDSDDWYLKDENNNITPILSPLFNDNNEIVWRYA